MAPRFLRVELDPTGIRNKSWYLQIALGHRIGCADAPLTWSPITRFPRQMTQAPNRTASAVNLTDKKRAAMELKSNRTASLAIRSKLIHRVIEQSIQDRPIRRYRNPVSREEAENDHQKRVTTQGKQLNAVHRTKRRSELKRHTRWHEFVRTKFPNSKDATSKETIRPMMRQG